jgi:hypothetical protein
MALQKRFKDPRKQFVDSYWTIISAVLSHGRGPMLAIAQVVDEPHQPSTPGVVSLMYLLVLSSGLFQD